MSVKTVVIFSVLLISGCAAIKDNVTPSEPKDGARARIRVAIPSNGNGRNVHAYPNSTCAGRNVPGKGRILSNITLSFEKTLNDQKNGIAQTDLSESGNFTKSEIYVQADVPITLTTFKVQSETGYVTMTPTMIITNKTFYRNGCSNGITFIPEENSDYEVIFGKDKISCIASVNKIIENQITPSLVPIQFSKATNCSD